MTYAPFTAWWVDFDPQIGSEQAGRRPAIVVGTQLAAQVAARNNLVIVVPCSSTDRSLPWQPKLNLGGHPGVAMCDQIKSISVRRISKPYPGTLSASEVAQIKHALGALIAL